MHMLECWNVCTISSLCGGALQSNTYTRHYTHMILAFDACMICTCMCSHYRRDYITKRYLHDQTIHAPSAKAGDMFGYGKASLSEDALTLGICSHGRDHWHNKERTDQGACVACLCHAGVLGLTCGQLHSSIQAAGVLSLFSCAMVRS